MGYFKHFSERDYFFVIYIANYLRIYESTLGITFNKLFSCEMNSL